jgi:hypothetical protein
MTEIDSRIPPHELGDPMDDLFSQLYEVFNADPFLVSFDWDTFNSGCFRFFDTHHEIPQHAELHDNYFHNFSPIWRSYMNSPLYDQAEEIWERALRPVWDWENSEAPNRIHKGAGYYYWGVTAILRRDFDRGFMLMHQAREEDIASHRAGNAGPAWAFVTLDDSLGPQVFQPKAQEVCDYLEQLLRTYRAQRNRTLDLNRFRSSFLSRLDLQDAAFLLVYVLFRLHTLLEETPHQIVGSLFAGQVSVNLLFDLCLLIENVIKQTREPQMRQRKAQRNNNRPIMFFDCAEELAFSANLNLQGPRLGQANRDFRTDFNGNVISILNQPGNLEDDLVIAYGFRNHGGHNVHSYEFVYERLPQIFQQIANVLFLSCEEFL